MGTPIATGEKNTNAALNHFPSMLKPSPMLNFLIFNSQG